MRDFRLNNLFLLDPNKADPFLGHVKNDFKGSLQNKVKQKNEYVYLGDSLGEYMPGPQYRKEKKVKQRLEDALMLDHLVFLGRKSDAVGKKGDQCDEKHEDDLACDAEMEAR